MRHVLLVKLADVDDDALRDALLSHLGDEAAEVRVVAPAAKLSVLQWLASDEDPARAEAAERAETTAAAVAAVPGAEAEPEVGDVDPVQATEDALRTFPADEIVVVEPPGEEEGWLERGTAASAFERFSLPVTRFEGSEAGLERRS